jgi:AcrR family transcriptional regulator
LRPEEGAVTTDTSTTRERILYEASMLFANQGYHRTSTREIAAAVGIRQPSLFYHFDSKAEIMRVLLHAAIDGAVAAVERQLGAEGSPAARLHRYVVEDLMSLCESPYYLAGTTTAAVLADPDFAEVEARYRRLFDARTRLIQQGIDAGEFLPVSAGFVSRAIEWVIEGLNTDMGTERPGDLESVIDEAADFCVRALLVDCTRLGEIR